jgi:starch phosphorylase
MAGTRFSVEIRPVLPQRLKRLEELADDLYYSWDRGVRRLFHHLDGDTWEASFHSPKIFLRRVPQHKLDAAVHDPILLEEYRRVLSAYDTYLEEKPDNQIQNFLDPEQDLVAYFSAEYGFHESVPIYAGGLGILGADYCKAMSKLWVPFVGVGILYHQGYFTQRILGGGEQVADYPYIDAADLPITPALQANGEEVRVHVQLPDGEAISSCICWTVTCPLTPPRIAPSLTSSMEAMPIPASNKKLCWESEAFVPCALSASRPPYGTSTKAMLRF